MRRLTSIVAVNPQGAIGAGNTLPWRVRSDLRFFREQTRGHVVIMGRKTFQSLGKPLPDRKNIVVTRGFGLLPGHDDCRSAASIEEALVCAERWRAPAQEVIVIGGATMYEQFARYVDRYLITEIDKAVPDADTFLDPAIVGDVAGWSARTLAHGAADGAGDEADYRIFELVRRDPATAAAARAAAIATWPPARSRASGAGSGAKAAI
jgi:dihydrofolate reductase